MAFFPRPVKPSVAIADLRAFMASRGKHHWGILVAAIAVPMFFITLILIDPVKEKYKEPEVTYIRMNMKGDEKIRTFHDQRAKEEAKYYEQQKAEQAKIRAEFKKLKDMGI